MWVASLKSVKQSGGKMPYGVVWGRATRKMLTFDDLIGNPDRNAGNILIGPPGELILIDHSRAFIDGRQAAAQDRARRRRVVGAHPGAHA